MGQQLGLPEEMVWRHPFPGPGLAIRIVGEVTPERLETLLAVMEGWVQVVTAQAVAPHLPHAVALAEMVRRRRAQGGAAEQLFAMAKTVDRGAGRSDPLPLRLLGKGVGAYSAERVAELVKRLVRRR